ncbi:MAG TPA: hypothetical protein VEY33_09730 [Gemmatimonadota bacterium]|nr:hypothetical protein [Gemmatimonadota bacterium]
MKEHDDYGEHPRGTLALVALMGLVYALGWAAMYVFLYLERGAVRP